MTNETFLKKLGKNIAHLREEAGLSQTELAHRCDKDRQTINRIEKGRTNSTALSLFQVAKEIGVPLKDLFDFD